MSKAKKKSHKGQHRHFTNPEEIAAQMREEANKNTWRETRDSDDSDSDSEDEMQSRKGVEGLIEIENPNRVTHKMKKASELDTTSEAKAPLTRREREEIEKQQARLRYQKLHAEGKTDEARADLARLALIRKQREDAAKKRDEEKKAREAAKAKKK
ncbi:28 kDa heat- and acid-stable phosphoprotein-like [Ptychodera flava]|uniref:28 kDa heat- and acid-stable phosphoprotein-like n=1 Tax=Ptychodera flava TaxID=63121 RepID=UPI00396A67B2